MRLKFKKEDEDFSVIESETLVIFSFTPKKFELLEQIDSDMGMLESASNFFFFSLIYEMNEILKLFQPYSYLNIYCRCLWNEFSTYTELEYKNGYYTVIE
jgi:magnesium transporter